MVCTPEELKSKTLALCGAYQLGHCFNGVFVSGASKSFRLYCDVARAVENPARSYYVVGVCAICRALHAPATKAGLFVGWPMSDGCGVFYVQSLTLNHKKSLVA